MHGPHVYWTSFGGSIGRADLDGDAADQEFISLPADSHPFGIAVDDSSVYWTRAFTETIDRAAIDGSGIELGLIELAPLGPDYIALDDEHVYWSNNVTDTIGRAKLDGSDPDPMFMPLPEGSHPYGLTVTDSHIYWADIGNTAIGRARLDGSELDPGFVELPIGALPYDVAVDAGSDTRLRGAASADRVQRRRGPVKVEVRLKAGERLTATVKGTIAVRGHSYGLGTRSLELGDDARRSLHLRPTRRGARREVADALDAGRTARAEVTARLVDLASNAESERLRVRVVR